MRSQGHARHVVRRTQDFSRESARRRSPRALTLRPRPPTGGGREPSAAEETSTDGCKTDPEPGMDSRRATVRNMRSKCRCSCVLQFTFRRAVSCVLHRPPSQVIHCIVLYFSSLSPLGARSEKTAQVSHIPTWGAQM